jgi:hypothetical protein
MVTNGLISHITSKKLTALSQEFIDLRVVTQVMSLIVVQLGNTLKSVILLLSLRGEGSLTLPLYLT